MNYALSMLMLLAINLDSVISVREIAQRQNVPYAFARSIQRDLIKAGLTTTKFGVTGGVLLAREPESITLYDIVTAIHGDTTYLSREVPHSHDMPDEHSHNSWVHPIWAEADQVVTEFLKSKKLTDLLLT